MIQWSSVYIYDGLVGVGYKDLTFDVHDLSDDGSEPNLDLTTPSDFLYFGLDRTFDGIFWDVEGASLWPEVPIMEYYNGSIWKRLPVTVNANLRKSGVMRFNIPMDWAKAVLGDVDSVLSPHDSGLRDEDQAGGDEKYWVRMAGGNKDDNIDTPLVSGRPVVRQSFPFPSYSLTTPEECADLMAIRVDFSGKTKPTRSDVERIIQRIEGRIEGYSLHSWKPQYRADEFHEFNRWGMGLRRYPLIRAFDLELWNGETFEPLREGRQNDYFVDKRTGIINFARFIHLPFAYRRVRAYGFGEQRRSLRISYIWGKDELDERYYMAKDIATKLTVADVWSSYDFSTLIPSGTDKFSIDQRIERWTEDAEERLEELRSLRVYTP